jgi:hypothetical protein
MLALLVLLAVERWIEPRVRRWYDARHARWLASEPKAYRDLADACRVGDLLAVYRAFTIWRRRAPHEAAVQSLAEALEEALFAGAPWIPARSRALLQDVAALRQARHRLTTAGLRPLNPLSTGGLP